MKTLLSVHRYCIMFLLAGGVMAAQSRAGGTAAAVPVETPGANLPAQPIGANDLVAITVYGAPEFTRTVRISAEGWLRLPMVKRQIAAQGLLPVDLEKAIAEALEQEQILVGPVVTVTVAEYHSRPISVAGAVRNPVTFQAVGPVTLLEAVARAGGLDAAAGSDILVTRRVAVTAGQSAQLVERVPVRGLIDNAEARYNLTLTGGEEIRVPEAGRIYVVGNVKKPGAYPVHDGAESTLLQALAYAEGVMPYAGKKAFVYRREASGSRNEIVVELRRVLDRKSPDVTLAPNDILYIPDNKGSRLGIAALERVLMFGSTAGATALIYNGFR
jgi:polysaccharide biosynthesis/export protein